MLESRPSESPKPGSPEVRFLNLTRLIASEIDEYVHVFRSVLESGQYVGGREVEAFEREFSKWLGPDLHAVGVGNGTDAITLAARALQLPEGSEAIVPAMSFFATAEGLLHAGLRVRLADVSDGTWLIDLDRLESALTPATRLIVPVHLYGQMAPMDAIREMADRHGCLVLEDAAQAHGATWKGRGVGAWGDIATFSFYPGKNLGAFGDGGAVVSKSIHLSSRVRALSSHGGLQKYVHDAVGYNSRLDAIQAALLRLKLKHLDEWNRKRRSVAARYREQLRDLEWLQLPVESLDAEPVYHLFVVLVENRERFQAWLKKRGVETGIHYPRALHQLPALAGRVDESGFPVAERLASQGVSLPMCPTLTDSDIDRVVASVRAYEP